MAFRVSSLNKSRLSQQLSLSPNLQSQITAQNKKCSIPRTLPFATFYITMADEEQPELTEEEIFEANRLACQQVTEEVVDKICTKGGKMLYEKYLKRRVLPYISHRTLRDVVSMVNWLNLVRDKGEPAGQRASNWYCDEEPSIVPVDTWASGAVQVRQKQSLYVPLSTRGNETKGDDAAPSVTGTNRTRGSKRPGSRATRGTRATKGGSRKTKDPEQLLAERIITLTDEQLGIREATADTGGSGGGKPKVTREERARLRAIRDMERAERAAIKRAEDEKQRKIDEIAAHETMMKELKGKEWTLDRDGKVIIIRPPNVAKLPSYVDEPDIFVRSDANDGGNGRGATRGTTPGTASGKSPSRGGSPGKKKKSKKQQSNSEDSDQYFRESVSQQPPLVQSMDVQTGVVLTEGEAKKAGPRAEENPKRMTRSAFLMHQTLVDEDEQAGKTNQMGESTLGGGGPESPGNNKLNSTVGATSTSPEMEAKIANAMADMDIMSGARALSSAGGMSSMGGEVDDENIRLINAADWGANPGQTREPNKPPLIHKPTEKERFLILGRGGDARDRKYMNKIAGSSPTRMAPPLNVGSVVGHGLGDLGDSVVDMALMGMDGGASTGSLMSIAPPLGNSISPNKKKIQKWGEIGPADSIKITEAASKYFAPSSSAIDTPNLRRNR